VNSIVCLKQVPDTEAQIRVKPDGSGIIAQDIKYVINPYDEFGVEEALKFKEKFGTGTVTIVSMGPQRAIESIRMALAMGADNAIHLDDPAFEDGDAFTTAKVLAQAIKGLEYDIIFCGRQAIDDDFAQVGSALAELLGLPQIYLVTKVEVAPDKKKARVNRQIVGGEEILDCSLPAVLTCQKGLNEPRYASLPGIMKAKKKEVKTINAATLGIDLNQVGKAGAKCRIIKMSSPPSRSSGKKITGADATETAPQLVKLLREESKVI
jgi:electron transfer flavoprotein beta subunit